MSLLTCSFLFPSRKSWDLILADGPQQLPLAMKLLHLLGKQQKIIPYLGGETPYYLWSGYYGRKTERLMKQFLKWDAYLCLGEMTAELVRSLVPQERHKDIFVIQNFIRAERWHELSDCSADLVQNRMLFIGHGPAGHRLFYKGLDLMFEAFSLVRQRLPALSWTIVGDWDSDVRKKLHRDYGVPESSVSWRGSQTHLKETFAEHALYFHCSRGDAWPNTVMEAMAAGMPALVSQWTGTRELARGVDERFVAPLNAAIIAERIQWYFSLGRSERIRFGSQARTIIESRCTETRAIRVFRDRLKDILDHFGLDHVSLPDHSCC